MRLEPGQEIGPYRVIEQIGRGGMATVYKAHQPALARYVAIKVLPDYLSDDPAFRARFQAEALAVAALRHPSIPAIYDYGEMGGATVMVTDYVDGGTLQDQMGRPLPLDYVVKILEPVASALDYAHARGVLHRDVKPQNVLIARDGRPLLNDFGLARMMESDQRVSVAGEIMGTPEYMAPEQCVGGDVGPAADIYSLAVIAYQMLTGRVPYTAATPAAVLMAQVQSPLPPPRSVNPQLDETVESALLTGLAKNAADRPRSATLLIGGLHGGSLLGGPRPLPVGVMPAGSAETVVRAPGRGPGAAGAAAGAGVASGEPGRPRGRRLPVVPLVLGGLLLLAVVGGGGWVALRGLHPVGPPAGEPSPEASPSPEANLLRQFPPRGPVLPGGMEGPLAWEAKLAGNADDWTVMKAGGPATVMPREGMLALNVTGADGNVRVGWNTEPHDSYVTEMRAVAAPRSQSTFWWVIRTGDAAAGVGNLVVSIDLATGNGRLEYHPPGSGTTPEIQGDAFYVPGLRSREVFGLEAISEPSELKVYVNGTQVVDYNEDGHTSPTGGIGFEMFGRPGGLQVTDARVYSLP